MIIIHRWQFCHFANNHGPATKEYRWRPGTDYNYGALPPRYPVPALPMKLQPMKHGIALIERDAIGWRFVIS